MRLLSLLKPLLLLLRHHRRLRTTSEALERRVKGGRDSHSWCMYVVGHGYGGLGVGHGWRWWIVCMRDKARRVGRMSRDAGALRKCEGKTLMISGHTAFEVHSSW